LARLLSTEFGDDSVDVRIRRDISLSDGYELSPVESDNRKADLFQGYVNAVRPKELNAVRPKENPTDLEKLEPTKPEVSSTVSWFNDGMRNVCHNHLLAIKVAVEAGASLDLTPTVSQVETVLAYLANLQQVPSYSFLTH